MKKKEEFIFCPLGGSGEIGMNMNLFAYGNSENRKWIINGLEREFSRVVSGEQERIKVSLNIDSEYSKAVEILTDLNQYYDVFEPEVESTNSAEEENSSE